MSAGLTRAQRDCLGVIDEWTRQYGIPPTFREIQAELDLRSTSQVHWLVARLEERGALARIPGRPRSFTVLAPPPPIEDCEIALTEAVGPYLQSLGAGGAP